MALSLPQIPSNLRKFGFYGSFSTGIPAYSSAQRLLLIGPALDSGTATVGVPTRVESDPRVQFGNGSILAEMVTVSRLQRPFNEIWALPVNAAGAAAACTITVTAVPPAGTYAFWLFGRARRCEITVASSGETVTTVAAKIVAAANRQYTFAGAPHPLAQPFTADNVAGVVTLTMLHAGAMTNGRKWVHTRAGNEVSVLGDFVTISHTAVAGAGTPDVAAALSTIGDGHFQTVVTAYDDDTTAAAIDAWMAEQWSAVTMHYGFQVLARTGSYGTLAAAGDAMNARTRVLAAMRETPTPTWLIATALGAELHDRFNLGRPVEEAQIMARALAGITLKTVESSMTPGEAFTPAEVNNLYFDGVTPVKPEFDGSVTIGGRVITTYQRSALTGLEDVSWLDISDVMIPAYAMYWMRHYASFKHAGTSLIADTAPAREGQTRPMDYKATCIMAYGRLCAEGICADLAVYSDELIVEMSSDRKRINAQHPVRIAAPLLIMANDIRVR